MKSKRMLMGAAVVGCLTAAMMSGAYAQQGTNRNNQQNAGTSVNQTSTGSQKNGSTQAQQGAGVNAQSNSGAGSNQSTTGQSAATTQNKGTGQTAGVNRKQAHAANKGQPGNAATNRARNFAGRGVMRGERRRGHLASNALGERNWRGRVAARGRYGQGWRREGRLAAGGYGRNWRGNRFAYRYRGFNRGLSANYSSRGHRLYAYAPGYRYHTGAYYNYGPGYYGRYRTRAYYARRRYYNYAPGYDVGFAAGPYYAAGWNVAYAGPYFGYGPGFGFGIGMGPVGIGIGPPWVW